MRWVLNQLIPFDAIARWWYFLVAGPGVGLVFGLVTGFKPFRPLPKVVPNVEEPLGQAKGNITIWVAAQDWKDDLFFMVLGFLLASGMIWLLEEMRAYNQHKS